uniref:Secreted protein n=1 Tax=Mucochytrium quahogii TaxID=96639 RepID=A0A7S2SG28_9STRA|mmetsp:Transcript_1265/g.2010  ORF Transcript_1265/g.2010 Transcript_1265/m.2010 type:complete len:221 (-) Transcript_1265:60-722(-)
MKIWFPLGSIAITAVTAKHTLLPIDFDQHIEVSIASSSYSTPACVSSFMTAGSGNMTVKTSCKSATSEKAKNMLKKTAKKQWISSKRTKTPSLDQANVTWTQPINLLYQDKYGRSKNLAMVLSMDENQDTLYMGSSNECKVFGENQMLCDVLLFTNSKDRINVSRLNCKDYGCYDTKKLCEKDTTPDSEFQCYRDAGGEDSFCDLPVEMGDGATCWSMHD